MNGANGRNTARRRRADTIARCERIMETARRLPLTRDVLAEAIERATPAQLDLMEGWLDAEIEPRAIDLATKTAMRLASRPTRSPSASQTW